MPGLLDAGLGYQKNATSGFIRESAQQQRIDETNKNLDAQAAAQNEQMAASGVAAVAMIIAMCMA